MSMELLKKVQLFKNLDVKEINLLGSISKPVNFSAGELIIEENTPGKALYIIKKGEVRVTKDEIEEPGKERNLAILSVGEHFGEMALIEDQFTSAKIVADSDVELLSISREDLNKMLEEHSRLAAKLYYSICLTLSERLRRADMYILLLSE